MTFQDEHIRNIKDLAVHVCSLNFATQVYNLMLILDKNNDVSDALLVNQKSSSNSDVFMALSIYSFCREIS